MRRKSTRSSGKQSPEKGKQSDNSLKKTRRTSKRRRKSTSESENSEEEQDVKQITEYESSSNETNTKRTSSDTETNDNVIEKESENQEETMEKQDKKIKLKRNRSSATNAEGNDTNSEEKQISRRSRRRGSPKAEERTHQEDDDDDKKGKGKSKGKTKSKIEKSQPLNESETHNESEISTNAQVTPQSPQIVNTNPVDNLVDVAESAEDNKTEIEKREEDDRGDKDTSSNTKDYDKHKSSINENVIESLSENQNNTNEVSQEATEPLVNENDKQVVHKSNDNKIDETVKNEEIRTDEVTVTDNATHEELEKELGVPTNDTVQTEVSEEIVKSDEDFAGFTKEQTAAHNGSEFIEEPMEISMDVTFTIKADDSSIMVTEAEETLDDNQIETTATQSTSHEGKDVKDYPEKPHEKPSASKKVTILRDSSTKPEVSRRKGWGFSTYGLDLSTPIAIDTMIIQNIYTNVQFLEESEVKLDLEAKDRRKSITEIKERKRFERSVSSNDSDYRKYESQEEEKEQEDNANIIALNRKISIVDDSASKLKPPPSPAKNPLTNVLFITNLVRPFTIKQLRELLERTGKIKENGFWTDKIKSKCYVQYEKVEDSEATRNALHGVHWPIGNGKKLIIDYATEEDLKNARNPPVTPPIPDAIKVEKENQEAIKKLKEEEEERNREKIKEKRRHEHVREWDVGKAELHRARSRSRDRDRDRPEKRRHSRHSPSPFEEYLARKQKKAEEQVPQKLMDDLFQKTKTTPSIYWQPLSPEEIATKQQQRLERMAEHKRRLEESTRNRAEFGRGGPYRRRYD